ncbi:MAG: type II toxin-antitoxin system HicB family antitoxin [Planctomycetota bacterium]
MVAPKTTKHQFTAVLEPATDDDPWWVAYCPEVPGANGQGKTEETALEDLKHAIRLVLQVRLEEGLKNLPASARSATVVLD